MCVDGHAPTAWVPMINGQHGRIEEESLIRTFTLSHTEVKFSLCPRIREFDCHPEGNMCCAWSDLINLFRTTNRSTERFIIVYMIRPTSRTPELTTQHWIVIVLSLKWEIAVSVQGKVPWKGTWKSSEKCQVPNKTSVGVNIWKDLQYYHNGSHKSNWLPQHVLLFPPPKQTDGRYSGWQEILGSESAAFFFQPSAQKNKTVKSSPSWVFRKVSLDQNRKTAIVGVPKWSPPPVPNPVPRSLWKSLPRILETRRERVSLRVSPPPPGCVPSVVVGATVVVVVVVGGSETST